MEICDVMRTTFTVRGNSPQSRCRTRCCTGDEEIVATGAPEENIRPFVWNILLTARNEGDGGTPTTFIAAASGSCATWCWTSSCANVGMDPLDANSVALPLPGAGNRANLSGPRKGSVVEQTGEYRIAASREEVWAALNDPDVLGRCLDGCEAMKKVGDDRFDARVKARVGPVRATFDAELNLEDVAPPERYTIKGNVKGGPAGFARGSARVNLTDEGTQTLLRYAVDASVGGKLAQVGSRLIDGAARKMADDFFTRFQEEVGGAGQAGPGPEGQARMDASAGAGSEPQLPQGAAFYESGGKWMIWAAAFTALLLALLFAF